MNESSTQNINRLENVSFQQIACLLKCILRRTMHDKRLIRDMYLQECQNFDTTCRFLCELGLVESVGDTLIPTKRLGAMAVDLEASEDRLERLREVFAIELLKKSVALRTGVAHFLKDFYEIEGEYEYWPTLSQRIATSGIRNLLLELSVIDVAEKESIYTISSKYKEEVRVLRNYTMLGLNRLWAHIESREMVGEKAERAVLRIERQRLSNSPKLRDSIQHVSAEDASAGFDILSFEHASDQSPSIHRYIEVKAVGRVERKFFMSRNEMDCARRYGNKYCLYLLPYRGRGEYVEDNVEIIRNPMESLYSDETDWQNNVELMSFRC